METTVLRCVGKGWGNLMGGLGKPDGEGDLALLKKGSEGKREILENFGCKGLEYNG